METTTISMEEDFMKLVDILQAIGKFACDWQPLIAGLLALLGAYLTVRKVREQIELQRQQGDWEKERAQKVSRLRLSHALSELSYYYEQCIKAWKNKDAKACPELPKSSIDILIDAGANADQRNFGVFKEISSSSQIFNSRIRRTDLDYSTMLMDLISLKHHTNQLFDYARFKSDEVGFDQVDLASIYNILNIWKISDQNLDADTIAHIRSIMPDFEPPIDKIDIN